MLKPETQILVRGDYVLMKFDEEKRASSACVQAYGILCKSWPLFISVMALTLVKITKGPYNNKLIE